MQRERLPGQSDGLPRMDPICRYSVRDWLVCHTLYYPYTRHVHTDEIAAAIQSDLIKHG